jgi:DNA-binding response OmpR family regulator
LRILLVEDDPLLVSGLVLALQRAHYTVEHVADGRSAVRALGDNTFDLLILDLGLPLMDGTEVLSAIRNAGHMLPVLILSARDSTEDRILGLDLGADDYLVKPFELGELLARLRVLERRRNGGTVNKLQLGKLELDLAGLAVIWNGQPVELVENPQRVFNRTQLEESLYGWGEGVESNTIDVHVHHIRKKLSPEVIKTIRGVGYRIGQVDA